MPIVFQANIGRKTTDSLITSVALRERNGLTGPIDGSRGADMCLLAIVSEPSKAAQEAFLSAES